VLVRSATLIVLRCMLMILASPTAFAASEVSEPRSIEIFITSKMDVQDSQANVTVHELDGLAALDRELSEGLSGDPVTAQRQALERINALGDRVRSKAEHAIGGLVLAQEYGITKLPAVVFDGGISVVYGMTDVDQAIEIYRAGGRP